jgi:hypothetical protein
VFTCGYIVGMIPSERCSIYGCIRALDSSTLACAKDIAFHLTWFHGVIQTT